jgi:hypothetical protein
MDQMRLPERDLSLAAEDARILEMKRQRVILETEQRVNLEAQQRIDMEAERPSSATSSEFESKYNALFHPLKPRVNFDRLASPIGTRQPSPERPRLFNAFSKSEPIKTPLSLPQMIVIQRPAVELLSHVPIMGKVRQQLSHS